MTNHNLSALFVAAALTLPCAAQSTPSLTGGFVSSPSGGTRFAAVLAGPPGSLAAVAIGAQFARSPLATPFGLLQLEPAAIVFCLNVQLDTTGIGTVSLPVPASVHDVSLAAQSVFATPSGAVLGPSIACMFDMQGLVGPGPALFGGYDGKSGDWRYLALLPPGTKVRVWALPFDYPVKQVGSGTVGPEGRLELSGNYRSPDGATMKVEYQLPGSGQWRDLGMPMQVP